MDALERFSKFYNKNRHWILGGGLFALAIIVTVAVFILLPERKTVDEKLYLAEKYIREGEYQLAFYELEDILEFDSECVEAYQHMAIAYEGLGNMTDAINILRQGVVETNSTMLKRMLVEREGNFMVSDEELEDETSSFAETSDTESTAETTTEVPTTTKKPVTTKKPTTTKPTTTKAPTTEATTSAEETTTSADETTGATEETESTGDETSSTEESTTGESSDETSSTEESTPGETGNSSENAGSSDGDDASESETTSVATE